MRFFRHFALGVFLLVAAAPLARVALAEENGCGKFQYYNGDFQKHASPALQVAFAKVDEWLTVLAEALDAPSISFGVVYDQELVHYSSVGATNLNTMEKPTPDSIYRIGSISKVFTVLMALQIRDQGLISFEDTMAQLNPDFSVYNPWGVTPEERMGKSLTVKHLASQVSGLPREVPCAYDCDTATTESVLETLAQQTLLHATDVQPSYSNLAYALLGNIIPEYIGYGSYGETLSKYILKPMNLNSTGLYLSPEQKPFAATGYTYGGDDDDDSQKREADWIDLHWEGPAGQVFSSVRDLSKLLMQYFASFPSLYQRSLLGHFVVSPQSLREMLRPVFMHPDQTTGFGSPWEIFWRHGHMVRTKGGNVPGFSSEIAMVPEMKLGIVALFGTDGRESLITTSALDILIPAFEGWINEVEASTFMAPSETHYDDVVGWYGIEGDDSASIHVYIDEVSGFPMMSIPDIAGLGVLTPTTEEEMHTRDISDTSSSAFVFNSQYSDALYCFSITMEGKDGLPLTFVDKKNGLFQGFQTEGVYGVEFVRMDSAAEPKASLTKSSTASQWLRSAFPAASQRLD